MSENTPQPWEVWHARFDFSEGHGYKYRPVIVLASRADGSVVAMVTSATNRLSLEHDYLIREWKAAGLDKPSIARLDRIAEIPPPAIWALPASSAILPRSTLPQSERFFLKSFDNPRFPLVAGPSS